MNDHVQEDLGVLQSLMKLLILLFEVLKGDLVSLCFPSLI